MKHSYWHVTLPCGRTIDLMVAPEIDQETADKVVERIYKAGTIKPGRAPELPQGSDSPSA